MKRLGQYYCLTESEYNELGKNKKEYDELLDLMAKVLAKEKQTEDIELSRKEFVALYNLMVTQMDNNMEKGKDDNEIYGKDVTVHWHGYYCNCSDGATVYNYIVSNIEGISEELGDEDE